MYLAKVGYSMSIKGRNRQGLAKFRQQKELRKHMDVLDFEGKEALAGGDRSAERFGVSRMITRTAFFMFRMNGTPRAQGCAGAVFGFSNSRGNTKG